MRDALARVQAAVARHPRLLVTLFILALLVISADPVVAGDSGDVGTFRFGSSGDGPTNPSDG